MSEVRLYVDEDAGEAAVVQGLLARGFDVLTTADADRLGATDPEQLRFAAEHGRAIYTFNASDFARLHSEYLQNGIDHAGIIVIPEQRYSIGEKIRRLAGLLSGMSHRLHMSAGAERGRGRDRMRALPMALARFEMDQTRLSPALL
jgi:hypothetical protein